MDLLQALQVLGAPECLWLWPRGEFTCAENTDPSWRSCDVPQRIADDETCSAYGLELLLECEEW